MLYITNIYRFDIMEMSRANKQRLVFRLMVLLVAVVSFYDYFARKGVIE